MHKKAPIQRAIKMLFEPSEGVALRGTIYSNDYKDGATTHPFTGRLLGRDGVEYSVRGILSGVCFEPIERRGRPKNEGRDVALYFAFRWFRSAGHSEPLARKAVQSLWEENGWKGCSEYTHLNALIRKGKGIAHGLSVLAFVDEVAPGGAVLAMPPEAFKEAMPNQRIAVSGSGWIWAFGKECAQFARIEFDVPLSKDGLTGGSVGR